MKWLIRIHLMWNCATQVPRQTSFISQQTRPAPQKRTPFSTANVFFFSLEGPNGKEGALFFQPISSSACRNKVRLRQ
jgi:hypothetical protein